MNLQTDVLIIGGGATGGGIAWDLALRGVRVVLAEMGDLATGTSGRFHGLLHSGGRYAVRDPESAQECIDENRILRRIVPEAVEDTGGYFVLCPGDDEAYIETWLQGCKTAGIETSPVSIAEARRREPALNPAIRAVYAVPDGSIDSWDLLHLLQSAAESTGNATFLTYHRVDSLRREGNHISGARLTNLRNDEPVDIECALVINAAGAWAAEIGKLGGAAIGMKLSRGALLAYNIRWVNTVINKLRPPGDGDIFVPVGTVSVIGTTSVATDDPEDTRVEPWEVRRILEEAEAMTPGISRARILRSWGGVRPLYDPGIAADGRGAKRTFSVLDHAETDGIEGFISVLGGKLTTYRLMAERTADLACAKLNLSVSGSTSNVVLPSPQKAHPHQLKNRLNALEHGKNTSALICECEIVTEKQIRDALEAGRKGKNDTVTLNDLRRDLRLGMGPCQGGFCGYRAAAIRHEVLREAPTNTRDLLSEFIERRVGGMKALLWGHNLRQALLSEQLYARMIGLGVQPMPTTAPIFTADDFPFNQRISGKPRVVVIGAGLAGLTAALAALELGAQVEIVAFGQGSWSVMPGWLETGNVELLAAQPNHPYALAGIESLKAGLALLDQTIGLGGAHINSLTLSGIPRPIGYAPQSLNHTPATGSRLVVVGFEGWRDFFPQWIADQLNENSYQATTALVPMPNFAGNFDNWPYHLARWLGSESGQQMLREKLKPFATNADALIFPAVLGMQREKARKLETALNLPILEIPTLPPNVPGQRLEAALRKAILVRGGRITLGGKVVGYERKNGLIHGVIAETAVQGRKRILPADAVILATGGLYGGGLDSDYTGRVWETTAELAVRDVPPPETWFANDLLAGKEQPIHRARLAVNGHLQPLTDEDQPFAENLFAAGHILGGCSPISEGCSEGIDIATAAKAALGCIAGRAIE